MDRIRFFDFWFSFIGLLVLLPVFLLIAMIIKISSKGPVFFKQARVGKGGRDFNVLKFRTMYVDAAARGLLTIGGKDNRITAFGYYLRRHKLDELPQLINVLRGEMSIVGPRPEVRRFVNLYSVNQLRALQVLPGITDYASIAYRNENEILALADNPEDFYVREIMPKKIELNFRYIDNRSVAEYFRIITKTLVTSFRGS